jgi:hypothetical protein
MALLEIIATGAAAVQALEPIFERLNGARSVLLEVDNNTDATLTKISDEHSHGGFAEIPSIIIPPQKADVFGSQSLGGSLFTGTEGSVTYTSSDGFTLVVSWDNPWAGSNECDASLTGANAGKYKIIRTCGAGNEKAHMRYQLFVRLGWRHWFQIHPETVFNQQKPVTAIARLENQVDLFKVGLDGAVWSSWWNDDGQGWRGWFPIHPETVFRQDRPTTIIARVSQHLDLFRVGFDGRVWSSWWNEDVQEWRPWFQIHPEIDFDTSARITALARRQDHIDLFIVGKDGRVWSSWWHDDDIAWRPWFQIHPETVFAVDQEIVPLSRTSDHLDLFTVGLDGAVWSSWWHDDDIGWRPWFQIHPETRFAPNSRVTAITRSPDHIDLFVTGLNGAVWSSWWHDDDIGWRPWFPIHPETIFSQEHPVTALSRQSDHIDLFKVGFDGAVWSSWWDEA